MIDKANKVSKYEFGVKAGINLKKAIGKDLKGILDNANQTIQVAEQAKRVLKCVDELCQQNTALANRLIRGKFAPSGLDLWAIPNIRDLLDDAVNHTMDTHDIPCTELNVRLGWLDDFDKVPGGRGGLTPEWDGGTDVYNEFTIDGMSIYAAVFCGVFMGNLTENPRTRVRRVEVRIGNKTIRQYPRAMLPKGENAVLLVPDGVYSEAMKPHTIRFLTSGAPNLRNGTDGCTALPLVFIIERVGA